MNRKILAASLLILLLLTQNLYAQDLTQYVNPLIGTGGHGHTFPGAVVPFGMVQLSPDTRIDGGWDGCSGYHYSDSVIYGFTHTHLSGTGVSDYGDILLMPTIGEPQLNALVNGSYNKGYASHFSHKKETSSAGYYAVHLDDDDIDARFTVTPHVGFHKYIFPKSLQANIIFDLTHRDKVTASYVHIIDSRHIEGYRRSQGWAQNQVVYFYAEFSKQMESYGVALNDSLTRKAEADGTNVKAYFNFHTATGESIEVKVALSQVSMEGAMNNMRECMTWDFEAVKRDAAAAWNYELGKIEVAGNTDAVKRAFYTALYHCMIHPSLASDVDGKYLGRDFKVHQLEPGKNYYTVFSLWDTYRALHPLLTIIDRKRTADFINTFLLEYEQGGRLPVWELSSNETDCMIGYHSVSVIADAAMKGIKFNYALALNAMKHSAELDDRGLKAYKERGYISMEDESESVSKTLEYSYDDWCISQMAKLVGDSAAYQEFAERGQYWKNIFDWKRGFMRIKKNGGWYSPFKPFEVNGNYTEANAWQYLFAVPQDIDGLISMMGGKVKFEAKLDSLFSVSSQTEGREQSDISGLIGQYAQGNEPSHHMAYLYDYCGAPSKTQERVRQIMGMYTNTPDGLIGNEDCGQMSAWYVMSAMGFYQVTPGFPEYAIGSPLFDSVNIHLENQKTFSIIADNNSITNKYVSTLNILKPIDNIVSDRQTASSINGTDLSYESILDGDEVKMKMASVPINLTSLFIVGIRIGTGSFIPEPIIQSPGNSFSNALLISMMSSGFPTKQKIYFTQDGSTPTVHSKKYSKPFVINSTQKIMAIAIDEYGNHSKVVTASFHKTDKNYQVTYLTPANSEYAGDATTLTNDESGTNNFRNGQWQGWWGSDMQLMVDLGKETDISKVSAEFLQDQSSWIFFPKDFEVMLSADGKSFSDHMHITTSSDLLSQNDSIKNVMLEIPVSSIKARYIKIIAHNYGKLPLWHVSAGEEAWIFCDEIFVE